MSSPNLRYCYYSTAQVLLRTATILTKAWTNKGFKILQEDQTFKFCLFGAVDEATKQLFDQTYNDTHLSSIYLQRTSLKHFGISAVSVNDERGINSVFHLIILTLEELLKDALKFDPHFRQPKYIGA